MDLTEKELKRTLQILNIQIARNVSEKSVIIKKISDIALDGRKKKQLRELNERKKELQSDINLIDTIMKKLQFMNS